MTCTMNLRLMNKLGKFLVHFNVFAFEWNELNWIVFFFILSSMVIVNGNGVTIRHNIHFAYAGWYVFLRWFFNLLVFYVLRFCLFFLFLTNYTSVSSSSTFCCRPLAEFLWCCFRGSNASTIICSVPLISARQNGQPCMEFN